MAMAAAGIALADENSALAAGSGLSPQQASRFLGQAAIGHSHDDINTVVAKGIRGWLNDQFALPRAQTFWEYLIANKYDAAANVFTQKGFEPMVWSQLMGSQDVLRQRVGLALLDQWVVNINGFNGSWKAFVMAAHLDNLWDYAFGNYRDLMEVVSTSVPMGLYLTFLGSPKGNPKTGSLPDENYARELMQLFTIGLFELNLDGTQVLSGGQPVPTYTQTDVSQHARVWTGYNYANNDNTTPARMQLPMVVKPADHETGASSFLGINIPANATPAAARKLTLDGLFYHANLPPFVAKQLIQHMVTSNPSPAYVARVATAFVNNGKNVRGDMKAVITAILTDVEARNDAAALASRTFGKLREPVLRLTQWARAFKVTSPTGAWPFGNVSSNSTCIGESPGHAPTVFNWFRPGYSPPGTAIAAAGLAAPEFQITDEPQIISYVNYMQSVISIGAGEAQPDYSSLTPLAANSKSLLDELNLVLAAGQIGAVTLAAMKEALDTIPVGTASAIAYRIRAAILLVMASSEYLVQR